MLSAQRVLPLLPILQLQEIAQQWADLLRSDDVFEWREWPAASTDERTYVRLANAPDHEVWLIRWPAGTRAAMHDHGGVAGAAAMLEGTLTERVCIQRKPLRFRVEQWGPGDAKAFGPDHLHEVVNKASAVAYSVHVYAPQLEWMQFYTDTGGSLQPNYVQLARVSG